MLPLSPLMGEPGITSLDALTLPVLAALAYQGIIVAFASYLAWMWMLGRYPATKILVLAQKLSEMIVVEALRRGVTGYLCKDDVKADELGKGVRAVQDGETVLGKGVGSMVARGLGSTRGAAEHLTDRELEIIRAVAAGLSNKQIAHQAFISESTVKFHLQNASRKLNAHRRAEIVHRANAAGLL